jgi:mRNA deadenylase 3'-5' endonuclease subunit Ccr4
LDALQRPPSTDIIDAIEGTVESPKGVKKCVLQGFVDVDSESWNDQLKQIIEKIKKEPTMVSTYSHYSQLDGAHCTETGEPKYTNFCQTFRGTLDYIFLIEKGSNSTKTSFTLTPSQLLSIPDESYITQSVALPNYVFGSDHISLMSKLVFVCTPESNS